MYGWILAYTIPVSISFVLSTIWFTQKIEQHETDNPTKSTSLAFKPQKNTLLAF